MAVKKVALGCLMITAGLLPVALPAQTPQTPAPAHAMPRPDDLEPGVDTSRGEHGAVPPAAGVVQDSAAGAAQESQGARSRGRGGTKPATTPATPAGKAAQDRLQLDTSEITGNRELPKVMVIVPWKHADLGDLSGKPMNSLVDEVLQPIDRDVFQRQTRYYEALKPDTAPTGETPGAAPAPPQGR